MATDAELRAAIDALAKQVGNLESSLEADASHARWATQLQGRLTALAASAAAPARVVTPAPAEPAAPPPPQPNYQQTPAEAAGSVASWSADAYGKAKVPGWYHLQRKDLYQRRLQMAREAPK